MTKFIAGMNIVRSGYNGYITYTILTVIDGDTYVIRNNVDGLVSDAKVVTIDAEYIRTFNE